ncbi:MAG TPA: FG-GAP-like repeat-containing protein [Verrucomicrobiae bacterium]|nr:FG-GAP-like repeat-containing protein [Verrucomicrobiae bacterium]
MLRRCLLFGLIGLLPATAAEREWKEEKGYRWANLAPVGSKAGFTKLGFETGITFTNVLDEWTTTANRVLQNGSGVAIGDVDGDGRQDVFFCALDGRNALYKNLGDWKFKNIADDAGLVWTNRICRGAVFADIDGDGDLDLLVATTGEGVVCALNDGAGKFNDVTAAAGTGTHYGSVTMALADVDGNGTLDLYVANNRTDDIRDRGRVNLSMARGQLVIPPAFTDRLDVINGKMLEYGEPDFLYLNDGKGKFTPVSWTEGRFLDEHGKKLTRGPLDWGLSVFMRDLNDDGAPDIYVCNDYWTPDRIWMNDGKGNFRALDNLSLRHTSGSSMGADVADIDRDGHYDIYVVDMLSRSHRLRLRQMPAQTLAPAAVGVFEDRPQLLRNTLQWNRGDGTFAEIANYSGISASEWAWQPIFIDVDLDGFEDIVVPSGHVKDVQDLDANEAIKANERTFPQNVPTVEYEGKVIPFREAFVREKIRNNKFYPRLETPLVAYRNLGNLKFEETTAPWGLNDLGIHHGAATGDLDNDGDLDLIVNNLGTAAGVFRNDAAAPRVAVRLRGQSPNTQGIGADIKLSGGAVSMQRQEIFAGGRYESGSEPMIAFAGGSGAAMKVEVNWRSGKQSVIENVASNRIYEIAEDQAQPSTRGPAKEPPKPLFKNVSNLIAHQHIDEPFNDFARQPLLPKRLSQLGPGVSWFDVNGDNFDDLIIGGGKGGRLALYINTGKGGFELQQNAPLDTPLIRDLTTVLGWRDKNGQPVLLAGSANYEDGLLVSSAVRQFYLTDKKIDDSLAATESSSGPMALTDLDGDGNLDLFVGGRVIAGRYPEAASSRIFKGDGSKWQLDVENSRVLEKLGLVSGAVWTDLDNDGFAELVLACEWGPVRVFKNKAGKLREITKDLGLDKHTGLWSGVASGDLDGDGRMDLIVGNLGLNTPYHATSSQPLRMFWGDSEVAQRVDLVETEIDEESHTLAPRRRLDALASVIPGLRDRFATHAAFSSATVQQLSPRGKLTNEVSVTTLASTAFYNRGDHFEPKELPMQAQLSPIFGAVVGDFDGDGDQDVFVSQNFFPNEPDVGRFDAGRGLVVRNNGGTELEALSASECGVIIYGEQRGAAVADFDGDGRLDLAVGQNGAQTQLYLNTLAKPGLRIRLTPEVRAIGTKLRAGVAGKLGAIMEVQAGSGYWSQDSAVKLIGGKVDSLEVQWPGGKATVHSVPDGASTVTIDLTGKLTVGP